MRNNTKKNSDRNSSKSKVVREQPRKDSNRGKRVNYDNTRESKFDKDIDNCKMTDKSNDPNWYASNPELMTAAASLPFSTTTGQTIVLNDAVTSPSNGLNVVPGIKAITFDPAFGGGISLDAINAAKDSVYSYVVHANSRNTSYEAADLFQVIISGMNVFAAIAAGIRAYGTMKTYDQRNKYLPDGLVYAMGFDPQDLRNNLAQAWFDLNDVIAQTKQIWIPNTMPVLDRWFWMNSNVYMDSESVKGQYYVYVQSHFLGYCETYTRDGAGGCAWLQDGFDTPNPFGLLNPKGDVTAAANEHQQFTLAPGTNVKWSHYIAAVRELIAVLVNSEDRGIMMGDILKAYGSGNIYALAPIASTYTVTPVYDKEVLSQIENTNFFPYRYFGLGQLSNGRLSYYTSLSVDWCRPHTAQVSQNWGNYPMFRSILNFHQTDDPTPAQIMVATRMKVLGFDFVSYTPSGSTDLFYDIIPKAMGTEQPLASYTIMYNDDGTLGNVEEVIVFSDAGSITPPQAARWAAFDWAPWLYATREGATQFPKVGDNLQKQLFGPMPTAFKSSVYAGIGDYDYYTTIGVDELLKMHNTALYSEFGVPTL